MKLIFMGSLLSLALGSLVYADQSANYFSNDLATLAMDNAADADMDYTNDSAFDERAPRGGGPRGGGGHVGPRGGGGHRGGGHVGPRGGHFGRGGGRIVGGRWHPHFGWRAGWRHNWGWRPFWWRVGIVFPVFAWGVTVPVGYWQCTSFDQNLVVYSEIGPDLNQAAYGALYACGGPNYEAVGCYIPTNYCRLR